MLRPACPGPVPSASPGLQLHDCRIDAEIFFMERLFVADPFAPGPGLGHRLDSSKSFAGRDSCKLTLLRDRTEPCGIFPHLFRVGTGWDGDTELSRKSVNLLVLLVTCFDFEPAKTEDEFLFHGFASLIPAAATGDLWAVLIPLVFAA